MEFVDGVDLDKHVKQTEHGYLSWDDPKTKTIVMQLVTPGCDAGDAMSGAAFNTFGQ